MKNIIEVETKQEYNKIRRKEEEKDRRKEERKERR